MSIELAWAAGFWDGEGCTSIAYRGKYQRPRVILEIAQVDREVLDRFATVVGFGVVRGPYKPKTKNSNPYYRWGVEGNVRLGELRELLLPYISTVKLEQMDRAVKAQKDWLVDPRCPSNHALIVSSVGKWYCKQCLSTAGKKAATARWGIKAGD